MNLTLAECQRETAVSRRTLLRWIAAGKLHLRRDGTASLADVEKLKGMHRRGPRFRLTEMERLYYVRDAPALAAPFLRGQAGLALFASVASIVGNHCAGRPQLGPHLKVIVEKIYALL